MSASSQRTKRKLSLLQLAKELGNESKACQLMGYHRDSFYQIKRAFQTGGVAAVVERRRGPRGPHPNRVSPEVEQTILDFCLNFPAPTSYACRAWKSALPACAACGNAMTCSPATNARCAWKYRLATPPLYSPKRNFASSGDRIYTSSESGRSKPSWSESRLPLPLITIPNHTAAH